MRKNFAKIGLITAAVFGISSMFSANVLAAEGNLVKNGDYVNYEYSGNTKTLTVPYEGIYKIEAWGAQGGNYGSYSGGKGAYISGEVYLSENDTLSIAVGGQNGYIDGVYQGGSASAYGSGGGASYIHSSEKGYLLIAGGGGGASENENGHAGNTSDNQSGTNGALLNGSSGIAGGGGGYYGGIAGEYVYHHHTTACLHVHVGSQNVNGGCYTSPVYHNHIGSTAGGGCYTVPVYHSHTGSSTSGGGCYGTPVYHSHTGSTAGGGCYTVPVYHSHTGSTAGGGCYGAISYYTVNCGKTAGVTIDSYSLSCSKTVDSYYRNCNKEEHSHSGNSTNGGGCYGGKNTCSYYVTEVPVSSDVASCSSCKQTKVQEIKQTISHNKCGGSTTNTYKQCTCGAMYSGSRKSSGSHTYSYYINCGKNEHSHSGSTSGGGGCYGGVNYHSHSGNTTSGGACYSANYHSHSGSSASGGGCYGEKVYKLNCGKTTSTVISYNLGCGKTPTTIIGYNTNCGKTTSTIISYNLGCGKTPSTVVGYNINCGMTTDTILSYNLGCNKTTSTIEYYDVTCGLTGKNVCGYSEGQIVTSKAGYGGCSYAISSISNKNEKGGEREGNGYVRITLIAATDKIAPVINNAFISKTELTNTDVSVEIHAEDFDNTGDNRTAELQYCMLHEGNSTGYRNSNIFTIGQNGLYTFCVKDKAGNEETVDIEITNIDKSLPVVADISLNTDGWTNEDITITVTAHDNTSSVNAVSGINSYKLTDGETIIADWQTLNEFVVSKNGIYTVYVKDNVGNITSQDVNISNIDKTLPIIDNITLNENVWVNEDVIITVTAHDAPHHSDATSGIGYYKLMENSDTVFDWQSSNEFTVTQNGNYTVYVKDNAGNITSQDIAVANIDKEPPVINEIVYPNNYTNQDITVTINSTDDIGIVKYVLNGIEQADSVFTISENGEYTAIVYDVAGNMASADFNIQLIDRLAPKVIEMDTDDLWTCFNRTITVMAEDVSDSASVSSGISSYKLMKDGNTIADWQDSNELSAPENGIYTAYIKDNAGNETNADIEIINIDKFQPIIDDISFSSTNWTNENVTITVTAYDDNRDVSTTSGIELYSLVAGDTVIADWQESNIFTVEESNLYSVRVKDKASNITTEDAYVLSIDKIAPEIKDIVLSAESFTNEDIIMTVIAEDAKTGSNAVSSIASYKLMEESVVIANWQTSNEFTITRNGNYTVYAKDNAGNEVLQAIEINTIDKTAPVIGEIIINTDTLTSGRLTVTVNVYDTGDDGVENTDIEYKVMKGDIVIIDWQTSNELTFNDNGIYTIYIKDKAGNIITKEIEITTIDKSLPVISNIILNTELWTNEDITMTVEAYDIDNNGDVSDAILYSLTVNDEVIADWQESNVFNVEYNEIYTINVKDTAGNVSTQEKEIINIDKESPVVESITQIYNDEEADIASKTDAVKFKTVKIYAVDEGCGVKGYRLSEDGENWTPWQLSNKFEDLYKNGLYYVQVEDNLLNITDSTFTLSDMSEMFEVTYIDEDEYGNILNTTVLEAKLESGVSGADLGIGTEISEYYDGYVFVSCTSAIVSDVNPNIVYRYFMMKKYNVIFHNADGSILTDLTINHGDSIPAVVVEKERVISDNIATVYTFSHWEDSQGNVIDMSFTTSDKKLYPVFNEMQYPLSDSDEVIETDVDMSFELPDVSEIDISEIGKDVEYIETKKEPVAAPKKEDVTIEYGDVDIEKLKAKNPIQQIYTTIMDSKIATTAMPVLGSVGGTIAVYSLATIIMKYVTGAGLAQAIVFSWALLKKKKRYVKGAWLLSEQDMQYVDKFGRKLEVVADANGKYIFSRKGKPVSAINVEQQLELLNQKKISYDEFEKRIANSKVYTAFSKDVELEVWNVKQVNSVTNKKAKGFDLSKAIRNAIQKTGDYTVRINNSGKQAIVSLKFIAKNL